MTKRIIRTLLKEGWIEVRILRKNLYGWNGSKMTRGQFKNIGNKVFVEEIIAWCQERFDPADYTYAMAPTEFYQDQHHDTSNRFVFRQAHDAIIFQLRWAE